MVEAEGPRDPAPALIDAGMFIGSLLAGDPRHEEARPLVEQARRGDFAACTTARILSEVYGASSQDGSEPPREGRNLLRSLSGWLGNRDLRAANTEVPDAGREVGEAGDLVQLQLQSAWSQLSKQPRHGGFCLRSVQTL